MKPRIGASAAFFIIALAFLIDAFEGLLDFALIGVLVNSFIDIVAGMIFGIIFSHYGISVMKKNPAAFFGTLIVGFIPIVNALPEWTCYTCYIVFQNRVSRKKRAAGEEAAVY